MKSTRTTIWRVAVACSVMVLFINPVSLHAEFISLKSSTITVCGGVGTGGYCGENSGSTTGTTGCGSTWFAASSGSMTADGAALRAECGLVSGPGIDWLSQGVSWVSLSSIFLPQTSNLTFEFTGETFRHHHFGSYLKYTLTDLTANMIIDYRHWVTNPYFPGNDSLPYTTSYQFQLSHEYQLDLYAHSEISDHRYGYANLQLSIIPEPASLLLLGFGGLVLRRRIQK